MSEKSWGVFDVPAGASAPRCAPARLDEIHVAPCDDDGVLLCTHRLTIGCECRPTLVRNGPLDTPIISHREPRHPGANQPLDA